MLQPKYSYLEQFSEDDVEYFRQMPFSLSIPSHGVLVVHAGIVPGRPLEDQLLDDLINVRPAPSALSEEVTLECTSYHGSVLVSLVLQCYFFTSR